MNGIITVYLIIWSITVLAVCFLGEELISKSTYITGSNKYQGVKNIFICFKFLNVLASLIFTIVICSCICMAMCHEGEDDIIYPDKLSILTLTFLISNTILIMSIIGLIIDSYTPDLDTSTFSKFNNTIIGLAGVPIIYFFYELSHH